MMRTISCALAACCLVVAVARAQDSGRTETPEPAEAHNTMVLTGCLAAGGDASTFRLTNATPNKQATAIQPEAVATSGKRAVYELKAEKRLDAQAVAPVDLKSFVGHQVEVTARPDDTTASAPPAQAAGQPTTDPDPRKPADETVERLLVTTVKEVSSSCK
jgi:hypothetical protein